MLDISVIIPVYNVENHLRSTLASILRQEESNYEVILIDDGSTDTSGTICDEYALHYPDIIRVVHTENRGVCAARNLGTTIANGKYLYFVDSDDQLASDSLFTFLCTLIRENQQPALICFSYNIINISEKGTSLRTVTREDIEFNVKQEQGYTTFLRLSSTGEMLVVWNKLFLRMAVLDNGIKFVEGRMEDYRFVLDYIQCIAQVRYFNFVGYNYIRRQGERTLATSMALQAGKDYVELQKRMMSRSLTHQQAQLTSEIFYPQYIALVHYLLFNESEPAKIELSNLLKTDIIRHTIRLHKAQAVGERIRDFLILRELFTVYKFYLRL